MKQYLRNDIAAQVLTLGPQQGLFEAIYNRSQLKLDYDSTYTRNAARESLQCARRQLPVAGHHDGGLCPRWGWACASRAPARGVEPQRQLPDAPATSTSRWAAEPQDRTNACRDLTIDFLPADQLRTLRVVEVSEQAIISMYMNNRAVEALMRNQLDDAYAWARIATLQPGLRQHDERWS